MEVIGANNRAGKVYSSLLNLLEISKEIQLNNQKNLSFLSKLTVAKEYGTVKIYSARGSGHTSAIAKIIEEKFDKVVLVVPTMKIGRIFEKRFPKIKDKIHFCSPKCFDRLCGLSKYDAVIVDCSSFISKSKIDKLYEITYQSMNMPLYLFME